MKKFILKNLLSILIITTGLVIAICITLLFDEIITLAGYFVLSIGFLVLFIFGLEIFVFVEFRKTLTILNEQCDPYSFLKKLGIFESVHRRNPQFQANIRINKAAGLGSCGKFEDAQKILLTIDASKLKPIIKLMYYLNLANAYLGSQKIEESQEIINVNRELIKKSVIGMQLAETLNRNMTTIQYIINRSNGDDNGFEQYFLGLQNVKAGKSHLVFVHYVLGAFYLEQKRFAEAKQHLGIVVAEGNRLYYVAVAKQALKEMGGNEND